MAEENSLVVVDPHRQRSMADVGVVASHTVLTPRLAVRLPVEATHFVVRCARRFMERLD